MTPVEALEKAIQKIGSAKRLAEQLGVTKGAVSQWKLPDREIPARHCPDIERITDGLVRCEELNPAIDWTYIRTSKKTHKAARV